MKFQFIYIEKKDLHERFTWVKWDNIPLLDLEKPIKSGYKETLKSVMEKKYLRIKPRMSYSKL